MTGAYFVNWTEGRPDHGAKFDLVLGKWGDATSKSDRFSVALFFRLMTDTPEFMIIDAQGDEASCVLTDTALKRSDVVGTPLAHQIFAIADAVYMSESLREVRAWSDA